MGRRLLPAEHHRLLGNPAPIRDPRPPAGPPLADLPVPKYLDKPARAVWRETVTRAPWLVTADADAVAAYCVTVTRWRLALAEASAAPLVKLAANGSPCEHPASLAAARLGRDIVRGGAGLSRDAAAGVPAQMASRPRSPVRMRMTSSTELMKILPSPIRPVRAAFTIASIARSTTESSQTTSIFTLGRRSTTYSAPR